MLRLVSLGSLTVKKKRKMTKGLFGKPSFEEFVISKGVLGVKMCSEMMVASGMQSFTERV